MYLIYHYNQMNFLFFTEATVPIISDSVAGITSLETYWIQIFKL